MAPTATADRSVPAATITPAPTKGSTTAPSRIEADPELVKYPSFPSQPSTPEEFLTRAQEVATLLAQDAHIRDRGNVVPYRQVQLLKDSGLVTLLGPTAHGGGGQSWEVAYKVIRLIAQGEGSLAQLLGYHYIWFWTATFVGTQEQKERIEAWLTSNRYFLGGAVNPRDADLQVDPSKGDVWVFNGKKTFSTGSKISDVTILEGALPDGTHVFAPVLSKQPGIIYGDQWVDTLGMRATQSGGVTIDHVEVDPKDALGFVDGQFRPLGAFNTLILPAIQLVFTSFYLGIAQGAFSRAVAYTRENTRGWPYQPNPVTRGTDEFYINEGYGTLQARLFACEAQIDQTIQLASSLLHAEPRESVTPAQRADLAIRVAASKINAADFGLEVTNKIWEYQGARAVSGKYGFDLAYRDLRTHVLHDPLAWKRFEVGKWSLFGPGEEGWPTPTWYT